MSWRRVASVDSVLAGAALPVNVDGKEIAIYKIRDQYFSIENVCPHAYALLSDGLMEDDTIECPLHGAQFQISTGKCLSQMLRDLVKYPLKVEGNDILIDWKDEVPFEGGDAKQ